MENRESECAFLFVSLSDKRNLDVVARAIAPGGAVFRTGGSGQLVNALQEPNTFFLDLAVALVADYAFQVNVGCVIVSALF